MAGEKELICISNAKMWGGGVEESIECLTAKAGANRRTCPYPCIEDPAKPDEAPAFARTERCDAADGRQGPRRQVVMSHPFLTLVPWLVLAAAVALKICQFGNALQRQLTVKTLSTGQFRQSLERIWAKEPKSQDREVPL